jgi:hypothetical protein
MSTSVIQIADVAASVTSANSTEASRTIVALASRYSDDPIVLSVHLKRLLISQFTPSALRELASIMEYESPGMIARRRLSSTSVNALAEILVSGRRPTVGWWKRQLEVVTHDA